MTSASLVRLDLSSCPILSSVNINCPKLQELNLSSCATLAYVQFNTADLISLNLSGLQSTRALQIQGCQRLTHIDLSYSHLRNGSLASLPPPFSFNYLTRFTFFKGAVLKEFGNCCPNVTYLNLSGCIGICTTMSGEFAGLHLVCTNTPILNTNSQRKYLKRKIGRLSKNSP